MLQRELGSIQADLLDRRTRLVAAREQVLGSDELARLIDEVDATLRRIASGAFGLCEHCHEPIEKDRLLADPLVRFCLDHLSREDQRALEDDLALARQIQTALLPKSLPPGAVWETQYWYDPAGPVSGDYCDVIVPDGQDPLLVLTGDVSGKGIAASLLVSHLHSMFRSMAGGGSLPRMMERASRLLCESTNPNHYATLACAQADLAGDVEVCNAGHCPPLLIGADGVTQIEPGGLPLGMFCSARYTSRRLRLNPGDMLVFYTDGVTEALNPEGEMYGPERLTAALKRNRGMAAEPAITACLQEWNTFRGGVPAKDDVTILALRRNGC